MAGGIVLQPSGGLHDAPTEGSRAYAIAVCLFASIGGVFFGYDQGVTGGVLVMDSYIEDFCIGYDGNTREQCYAATADLPDSWTTFTTVYNVLYYVGCIAGAYVGGVIVDKFGRRATIFNSGVLFSIGTIMLVLANKGNHTLVYFARWIQGMGVGNSSFAIPLFGAEMAPKELRGMLSGFMQMTVVTGILIAGLVNYAVKDFAGGWRTTNAIAMVFTIIVMAGIFCMPESPRWTYKVKGRDEAEAVLKRLRRTDNVGIELQAIGDALEEEGHDRASWSDLWHPSIRPRLIMACSLQLLQQASGINPIFTYGGQIFQDIVPGGGIVSLLILQIVNFVSTIPAMYLVDKVGRRNLLLFGAAGMVVGQLVTAIAFSAGCHGNTDNADCNTGAAWTMVVFCAFYIFNFAISWGPICWVYAAEIFPLHLRAKAVSASTMCNWCMGSLMIGIPKLFPYLNINGVFFLFSALCVVAYVFVYFKCPETKGVLLEDVEHLFAKGVPARHARKMLDAQSAKYLEATTPKEA
ncbi:sugar transporter, partial [Achlya hypogyna]